MVLFGLDISHHQGSRPQSWFNQARAEGCEYMIMKATESSGFVDARFHENLQKARTAGMLVAAYHYQRAGVSAAEQVANVRRVVPRDVPVIPDVEGNSGNVALTRDIVRLLQDQNYRVPLTYLPRWYWLQIGKPNLAGLPPLWSSRYPDNVQGTILDEYADVPAHYWEGYGGLGVALLQFSSSGRVAGYAPLDLNAFRGTRQEFAALLGGQAAPPTQPNPTNLILMEDTTMQLDPTKSSASIPVPAGASHFTVCTGYDGKVTIGAVKFIGTAGDEGVNFVDGDADGHAIGLEVHGGRPYSVKIPPDTVNVELAYTLTGDPAAGASAGVR